MILARYFIHVWIGVKYFFPTWCRISKSSIWQSSVFFRHPVWSYHRHNIPTCCKLELGQRLVRQLCSALSCKLWGCHRGLWRRSSKSCTRRPTTKRRRSCCCCCLCCCAHQGSCRGGGRGWGGARGRAGRCGLKIIFCSKICYYYGSKWLCSTTSNMYAWALSSSSSWSTLPSSSWSS